MVPLNGIRRCLFQVRLLGLLGMMAASAQAGSITWTNVNGGAWNVAANWTPNQVPTAGDTATIAAAGTYTVTVNSAAAVAGLCVGNQTGTQSVVLASSTLTLDGPLDVSGNGQFTLSGGSLAGTATLTGTADWTSGAVATNGVVSISSGGLLRISGSSSKVLHGGLTNAGTVTWSGGALYTAGVIVNLPSAVFDIQGDTRFFRETGSPWFTNDGLLRKSGGTGTVNFNTVPLMNTGALEVETGSISYASGSVFREGTVFAGAGTNLLGSGTVTLDGMIESENLVLGGATVNGTNTLTGAVDYTSGTLAADGAMTIPSGTLLRISGSLDKVLYGVLTNAGTVTWSGGALYTAGLIVNLPSAVFDIQGDTRFSRETGSPWFTNDGLLRKSGGTGTVNFNTVPLMNTGALEVETGSISYASGSVFREGTVFAGAGTNLLGSGTVTLDGMIESDNLLWSGATVTGTNRLSGTVDWTSGRLATNGAMTIDGLLRISSEYGKRLYGLLTNAGTLAWADGRVDFYGGLLVNADGATLQMTGAVNLARQALGSLLVNAGTLRQVGTSSAASFGSVPLENTGVVDVQGGVLTVQYFTNQPTGRLNFGFHSGTDFGRIAISSTAALAGGLGAKMLDGFIPVDNDTFQVMTYTAAAGTFTDLSGLYIGNGLRLEPIPTSTSLSLKASELKVPGPPAVSSVMPPPNGIHVSTNDVITVGFSEAMNPATITSLTLQLMDASSNLLTGQISYDAYNITATLRPTSPLQENSLYHALVTTSVTDLDGEALPADYSWDFWTLAGDTIAFTADDLIDWGNTNYEHLRIIVDGATLTINGAHQFKSLELTNNATLTHSPTNGLQTNLLDLAIQEYVSVGPACWIDMQARGHGSGFGPGVGQHSGSYGSGAGHGGLGGDGEGIPGGAPYGSPYEPVDLGSGGGPGGSDSELPGGSGGGAIKIAAGGSIIVDGVITASGGNGTIGSGSGGGGSGGSVWLAASEILGSGRILANGGHGAVKAGGGSGGRIAMYYGGTTFAGTVSVCGGVGFESGGAGSIFSKAADQPDGTLLIPDCPPLGMPDLEPISFVAPDGVNVMSTGTFHWTVRNNGPGVAAPYFQWHDYLYLSLDEDFDSGLDILLEDAPVRTFVNPGEAYSAESTGTAPCIPDGDYYVLVVTDRSGELAEAKEANNVKAFPVTVGIPDVTPVALNLCWYRERYCEYHCTITNQGTGVSGYGNLSQYLYFSTNGLLDEYAQIVCTLPTYNPIPAGTSITLTNEIALPHACTNTFYIIVKLEQRPGHTCELDLANNTRAFKTDAGEEVIRPDQGPIVVNEPIPVPPWMTLRIEAGTILKFTSLLAGISVGGRLVIQGTPSNPVILTSAKDDTAGGDTNGDGSETTPCASDWGGISLDNSLAYATLHGFDIRYADKALLFFYQSSWLMPDLRADLSRARFSHNACCLENWNYLSTISADSCLFTENEMVFSGYNSPRMVLRNCTVVSNERVGGGGHVLLTLENSVFAFNALRMALGSTLEEIEVRNTLFYEPLSQTTSGYPPIMMGSELFAANGNLELDPLFVDRLAGDFELGPMSPAVDSAYGSSATAARDLLGRARYDDLGMPNAGRGFPCFVDMGAFERQEDTRAPDLAVTHVSAPTPQSLSAGASFSLDWTVANNGLESTGPTNWQDVVYLSTDPYLSTNDLVIARVTNNLALVPGQVYSPSSTSSVPANVTGLRYVLIRANATRTFAEPVASNNEGTAPALLEVDVPVLNPGVLLNGTIGQGQWTYVRIEVTESRTVSLTLDGAVATGSLGLYVRRGLAPGLNQYDYAAATPPSPDRLLRLPAPEPGSYYIGIYGASVPGGTTTFMLTTDVTALNVREVSPDLVGNGGKVTLQIVGDNFDPATQVRLLGVGGATIEGEESFHDATSLCGTFDLQAAAAAPGLYDVEVTNPDASTATKIGGVEVESGGVAYFDAWLTLPGLARPERNIYVTVNYWNIGNVDLPSPMLVLESREDAQWQGVPHLGVAFTPDPDKWRPGSGVSFMALASTGPAAVLRPGQLESIRIPVRTPFALGDMPFSLYAVGLPDGAGLDEPLDWTQLGESLRPADMSTDAWNALFGVLTDEVGTTWGEYLTTLRDNAAYLGGLNQRVTDVGELFAFELLQANGLTPVRSLASAVDAAAPAPGLPLVFGRVFPQSLAQRFELGPLGRGWSHNWELALTQSADGTVTIKGPGGSRRTFTTDDVTYRPQPGDHATLTALAGGTFTLREPDGLVYAFHADGKLDCVEDTNGNRITAGYSGNSLNSLNHSSGQFLLITNNASGRIASVTDPVGRQTIFIYDASGEHLASVQYYDGRTVAYDYQSLLTRAAAHALTNIAYTGGTERYFSFDSLGRLTETSLNGGSERVCFGYPAPGEVVATNALGNATQFFFDQRGLLVRTSDPLGNAVNLAFDNNYNLTQVTDPAGRSYAYGYDANGNLTQSTDPLGSVSRFTFRGSLNRLGNVLDAKGIVTRYDHNDAGNLLSITYADQSRESWGYDAFGNATWWTNRRGSPIEYRYDAVGHLTNKVYNDGSQAIYQYDTRGNMTNAATLDTTGLVTHFSAMAYDPSDRLTNITYPDNKWLAFTYDVAGRRQSSLDQTGHLLVYAYDGLGRLQSMTNTLGEEIVRYSYDPAGRLQHKRVGNGVCTTYDYDVAGQLLCLTNHLADGSSISWFNYTYDSRGRRTSMDTHYGKWSYDYDDLGQLTHAVLASTAPNIPNQDLTYVYDALGNRIRTIENGVTTEYTANNLNQYVWVASTNYVFDRDGNLTQEITLGSTNTFGYSDENRLSSVTKGADVWRYNYDPMGNRVATTQNSVATCYLIDPIGPGNLISSYCIGGASIEHYDHGLGLLLKLDADENPAYYTFDPSGSCQALLSGGGEEVAIYAYSPFGSALGRAESVVNPFQFGGESGILWDTGGHFFMRARSYLPELGRFLGVDPIRVASGDANFYRFVFNDPVAEADPLGLGVFRVSIRNVVVPFGRDPATRRIYVGVGLSASTIPSCVRFFGKDGARGWNLGWPKLCSVSYGSRNPRSGLGFCIQSALPLLRGYSVSGNLADEVLTIDEAEGVAMSLRFDFMWATPYRLPVAYDLLGDIGLWIFMHELPLSPWLLYSTDVLDRLTYACLGIVVSASPEDKWGPPGVDAPGTPTNALQRFVLPGQVMNYRIEIWNKTDAVVPTQDAIISDVLNPAIFDLSTFEFTRVGFLSWDQAVPGGQVLYEWLDTRPGMNIAVEVLGDIDPGTGEILWWFHTVDPETGDYPEDPYAGFLPPFNPETRYEIGWMEFRVQTWPDLPSGTVITNQALVQFDFMGEWGQAPKEGPWLNTIDCGPPTSQMLALPESTSTTAFEVQWSGADDAGGSGIATYDIYVSTNGGSRTLWLANATGTSATFSGHNGDTYAFDCVATDYVDHREAEHGSPDTVTTVMAPVSISGTVQYYPLAYPPDQPPTKYVGDATVCLVENPSGSVVSAPDGTYTLNNVPGVQDHGVSASKMEDTPAANGVSTLDIALIRRHILNLALLDSPYKLLAADVNGSRTVSTLDIALIRRLVLGLSTSLPSGVWRFVPSDYVFPDVRNPWEAPADRWYFRILEDAAAQDYFAIKFGDVNNSWTPPALGLGGARSDPSNSGGICVSLHVGRHLAPPGGTVLVPITVNGFDQVTSVQFTLAWDPAVLRFIGIADSNLRGFAESNYSTAGLSSGKLAVSWDDTEAKELTLANGSVLLKVVFELVGQASSASTVAFADAPTVGEASINLVPAGFEGLNGHVTVAPIPVVTYSWDASSGVFGLLIPTAPGVRYVLEYNDSLSGTPWIVLMRVIGDGTTMTLMDANAASQQRFYRVRIE